MIGLGTIINVGCVIAGGIGGLLFGKKLTKRFQDILMTSCGVSVLFLGIAGCMEQMLSVSEGKLSSGGALFLVGCLTLGSLIGELLNIEHYLEKFGEWLKRKTGSTGDAGFVDAFLSASLTICIGAMAVIGSITDGLTGDYSILATKGIMDLVIILVMTASKGKGCIFSAIPVGIFQGLMTLCAVFIADFITPAALANITFIGSTLIFCVGVNLVWDKHIKVANMLPSILLAVAGAFVF